MHLVRFTLGLRLRLATANKSKSNLHDNILLNPRMYNMGQIDPNDASHVDCLKHFANFVSAFLDFVSNLLHSRTR